MSKQFYKEELGTMIAENSKLKDENIKLRIALCNLRDEFLDLGGNPNQLELFDKDGQLNLFENKPLTKPESEMSTEEEFVMEQELKEELDKLKAEMIADGKALREDYENTPGEETETMFVDFDSPYLEEEYTEEKWKQLIKPQFVEDFKKQYREKREDWKSSYGDGKKKNK
tara:strand:+ start:198 stop:710 length:513 start_codon:yes stop_codon:yes gene_type:complete